MARQRALAIPDQIRFCCICKPLARARCSSGRAGCRRPSLPWAGILGAVTRTAGNCLRSGAAGIHDTLPDDWVRGTDLFQRLVAAGDTHSRGCSPATSVATRIGCNSSNYLYGPTAIGGWYCLRRPLKNLGPRSVQKERERGLFPLLYREEVRCWRKKRRS